MRFLVIHGPNLDLLGTRSPEIYGRETLDEINTLIEETATDVGVDVEIRQTAGEEELIEFLSSRADAVDGALVNPAVYSHTSRALAEAIATLPYPVVEVHLSNIHAREPWRRRSVTAESAVGLIAGFKADSYALGLRALMVVAEKR